MAYDYSGNVALAQSLVAEFGRTVTLVQWDTDPADANKPWRAAADPEATPDKTEAVSAVAVPPSGESRLGLGQLADELVRRADVIFILGALPSGDDATDFDQVLDGTNRWRIVFVEKLAPGDTTLLYFIGGAR